MCDAYKQLHTVPFSVGAGPSRVLHALKQPDFTDQEGPVALATKTDPSCAPGGCKGFQTSDAGLPVLAFPAVRVWGWPPCPSLPFPPEPPSAEPESHCSAPMAPPPSLPSRPCGEEAQTTLGD